MKDIKLMMVLILVFISEKVFCQFNFDSIKICHEKGELKDVIVGEYEVKLAYGRLSSFSSKDGSISYDEKNKTFLLRNFLKNDSLRLQLLDEGVVIDTRDTSFVLNSPKSVGLVDSVADPYTDALFSIGNFGFAMGFTNGRLTKMGSSTPGKYLGIDVIQLQNAYKWNFLIESNNHMNTVLMTYFNRESYSLNIQDDKNKVGIRLEAKKKNGQVHRLQGLRVYGNAYFESDEMYELNYTNSGRLKKKTLGFNLECEY